MLACASLEFSRWLDELYPSACRLCGQACVDGVACPAHSLQQVSRAPTCGRCAIRLAPSLPAGATCAQCRLRPPPFARIRVLGEYRSSALPDWILALKYGGRPDLATPLMVALIEKLRAEAREQARSSAACPVEFPAAVDSAAWLVPVPLHPLRRLERGYDQAELLALACARGLGRELRHALVRRRHSPPQGAAGSSSRTANVRGAFLLDAGCRKALIGRDVVLIDDVITSGATVKEAARVLRRAGARRVEVLGIARAGRGLGDSANAIG